MNCKLVNPKRFSWPKHISTWLARMVDSFDVICLNANNHVPSIICIFSTSFARIFSSTSKGLHHSNNCFVKFFIVGWLNQYEVVVSLFMIHQLPFVVKFLLALETGKNFIDIVLIALFMLLADIFVPC